ncbi:ATP-dependent DNA ligase [Prescottella equi]|nr:hypothetical protein [Prescottella equi]SUE07113.1 ATP-dependent DNA ligase [Prescottella equi]
MLATLGEPPADEGWAFEMRWDGQRAVTEDRGGTVRMFSRTSNDITGTFPELTKRVGWIAVTAAVGVSSILAAAPTAGAQSYAPAPEELRPLVHSIAQRLSTADPVAAAKWWTDRPIDDPPQERDMLRPVRCAAPSARLERRLQGQGLRPYANRGTPRPDRQGCTPRTTQGRRQKLNHDTLLAPRGRRVETEERTSSTNHGPTTGAEWLRFLRTSLGLPLQGLVPHAAHQLRLTAYSHPPVPPPIPDTVPAAPART